MIERAMHDQGFFVYFSSATSPSQPPNETTPIGIQILECRFQLSLFHSSLISRSRKHGTIRQNVRSIPAKYSRTSEIGMIYGEGPGRFGAPGFAHTPVE